MLQGTRRRLDRLLGRRTAFPPPTPPTDVRDAERLRESLVRWQNEATERYGRLFLQSKPLLALRRERALFDALRNLGLVTRLGPSVYQACVRLFPLYGRFVAADLLSRRDPDQVFSLPGGTEIKRLYGDGSPSLYCRRIADSALIRLNTLNMSWVPTWLYDAVLRVALSTTDVSTAMRPLELVPPPFYRLRRRLRRLRDRLRG